jgi:hypothetical protein
MFRNVQVRMLFASRLLSNAEVRLLSNVMVRAAVDAWVNSARMLANANVRAAIDAGLAELRGPEIVVTSLVTDGC